MPLMRRSLPEAAIAHPPAPEDGEATRSDAAAQAAEGEGPQVPRDTSPTWELELLLSGAVLFALFQLPPLVESAFAWLEPRMGRDLGVVSFMGYVFTKTILYVLIVSFVVHLCLRAYWVALVGLDSVFPGGVRWEHSSAGPIVQRIYRERFPPLASQISRIDNVCSVIFAFAFLTVFAFVFGIGMAAVLGSVSVPLGRAVGMPWIAVFYVLMAVVLAPQMIASLVDKRMGARLNPEGRAARTIAAIGRFSYWVLGVALFGPILMTLVSNARKSIFYVVFYLFTFGLMAGVTLELFARKDLLVFDRFTYVAHADENAVHHSYYEDQRPAGGDFEGTPSIQSDMVRDPYVRLFIPYEPDRHNPALASGCPGARPAHAPGLRLHTHPVDEPDPDQSAAVVLGCLARMHRVALNGRPRPDLELRFYTHPKSGLRGMIAYVPAQGLPRGRNTLTIQRIPRPRAPGAEPPKKPLDPWTIPFWL